MKMIKVSALLITATLSMQSMAMDRLEANAEGSQAAPTELNMTFCENITSEALIAVALYTPNLTSLNLTGMAQITLEALIRAAELCPHITPLNQEGQQDEDTVLIDIADNYPYMTPLEDTDVFGSSTK